MSNDLVIDFQDYGLNVEDVSKVDQKRLKDIGVKIVENFKKYGFCYLKNHGVDESLLEDYLKVSRNFFEQPDAEKEKYIYPLDERYVFGWVKLGRETLNLKRSAGDLHEAFNYTPSFDNAWPPIDKFETLTKQVFSAGKELAYRFCDALSLGLDLSRGFMRDAHKGNLFEVRTIYYPPISDIENVVSDQARLGEHTDWGTFTFNFQDNVGGLEVQNPKGEYVPADPIPGTVIVTPSAILQHWTSDLLKGSEHRILIKDDERRKKVRQSIIFFVEPDDDYEIKCIDGLNKYEPILFKDYWNSRAKYSMKYD